MCFGVLVIGGVFWGINNLCCFGVLIIGGCFWILIIGVIICGGVWVSLCVGGTWGYVFVLMVCGCVCVLVVVCGCVPVLVVSGC